MVSLKKILKYIYLPRKKRDKLSLKWIGPVRKIKKKHSSYLREYQRKDKWLQSEQQEKNLKLPNKIKNYIYNE